tara:strand:+ start:14 stop:214 length:201 start_codon:yes stop_codon:yes gene_type:complete
MDDIIDAIATDASPAEIADSLKDVIFQKAAERVEALRPQTSASVFDTPETEIEDESEVDTEPQEEE